MRKLRGPGEVSVFGQGYRKFHSQEQISGPPSPYSVSLVGKSNLYCQEICQAGAGCVHKEAIFMVWVTWV